MKNIEEICSKFIKAINGIEPLKRHMSFKDFPSGSCGSSTEIIGTYLKQNGFGDFQYIEGSTKKIGSHVWAQQGDLIVDITANQFPEISNSIIVTTYSEWHNKFRVNSRHVIDIVGVNENARFPILPFYKKLCVIVENE
ncbi:hypothetical protein [Gilvimarinus sp. 1_MG-2023]|uniref:hypothetical protein n=1 Tax=Gilvimarinus sp. 1_MG-2023 TaxID=3062638 RepID=UPI0026E3E98C|nr:hypothetical protein [Gilvimarinus sp. 1_MG-2023]MDO6745913.1 hypothetical protein [Gilvimarinus sp. 1_MG-2023]